MKTKKCEDLFEKLHYCVQKHGWNDNHCQVTIKPKYDRCIIKRVRDRLLRYNTGQNEECILRKTRLINQAFGSAIDLSNSMFQKSSSFSALITTSIPPKIPRIVGTPLHFRKGLALYGCRGVRLVPFQDALSTTQQRIFPSNLSMTYFLMLGFATSQSGHQFLLVEESTIPVKIAIVYSCSSVT